MQSDLVHRIFSVLADEFTDDGHAKDKKYKSADLQKQHVEHGSKRTKKCRRARPQTAKDSPIPPRLTAQFAEGCPGTEAQHPPQRRLSRRPCIFHGLIVTPQDCNVPASESGRAKS